MRHRKGPGLFIVLLCGLCLFTFCRREKANWDDNLVAPIARGGLSLANLFPDTTIKSNADSTLKIAFEANLINYQLTSLLKIPDTSIVTRALDTVLAKFAFSPGQTLFSSSYYTTPPENQFNLPNGVELRFGIIRQGKIQFKLYNTVKQPLVYHFQLASATKNNHVLDTTINIPKANYTSSGVLISKGFAITTIDLSGYSIDMSGTNHTEFNTIVQGYTVSVANSAPADTLFLNQGLIDSLKFIGVVPQYAQGYFGSQVINVGPDTSSFGIFNHIKSGMLNLNSASVSLKVVNQFGVEMAANLQNITSINSHNPSTYTLTSPVLASPIHVNAAINNGINNAVTPTTKIITLNNSNSNITNFIGNLPDKLGYKLHAQLNPNGMQNGYNDFGYYGTAFSAYLDANIPLFFSASNLVLADTVKMDMSALSSQLNNVNRGQLILTATNSYPFSINLQGYLLDQNKAVIDVLFNQPNLIQAPPLDANLKVITPMQSKLFVPLSQTKLTNLKKARYVYYTATFNTSSQPNRVKFYNYYNLDLLLTADINYTLGK